MRPWNSKALLAFATVLCVRVLGEFQSRCTPPITCGPGSYVNWNCTKPICLPCDSQSFKTIASDLRTDSCSPCQQCVRVRNVKFKKACTTISDAVCECISDAYYMRPFDDDKCVPKPKPKPTPTYPVTAATTTTTTTPSMATSSMATTSMATTSMATTSMATTSMATMTQSVTTHVPFLSHSARGSASVEVGLLVGLSVVGAFVVIVTVVVIVFWRKLTREKKPSLEQDEVLLLPAPHNDKNKIRHDGDDDVDDGPIAHRVENPSSRDQLVTVHYTNDSEFRTDRDVLSETGPEPPEPSTDRRIKYVRKMQSDIQNKIGVQLLLHGHRNPAHYLHVAEHYEFTKTEMCQLQCTAQQQANISELFFQYLAGHRPNLTVQEFSSKIRGFGRIDLADDIESWVKEAELETPLPSQGTDDDLIHMQAS